MIFEKELKLSKKDATLHVLKIKHKNMLTALASEEKIWEHAPDKYYQANVFKEKWFDQAIKQMDANERVCFVIFYKDEIIGSSSYYEIDFSNKKTNIGYTWFHPSAWGTKINALSKLIMLEYAFETLNLSRVGFSVDRQNERSCRALKKYGIKQEGILRNHLVLPNRTRDSVIFSVIDNEWLETKKNLIDIVGIS